MDLESVKRHASHGSGAFAPGDFFALGENVVFEPGVLVFHPGRISLGSNVYVGHNAILKGYHRRRMLIGDDTWIGQGCFFHSAGGLRIGRAVGIGPMVKLLTSVHRDHDLAKPLICHDLKFAEIVIGDGADVGVGAIVLPGVRIGEGAQVGAGAVVTRDVEAFTVVAGNPARVLRKRG